MKRALLGLAVVTTLSMLGGACGGGGKEQAKQITLGSVAFGDHGTKDVSASTTLTLEADDYYFSPTFLKGKPGQKLTVTLSNDSKATLHNLSIAQLEIDKDVPAKSKVDVEFTFPQSGVILFLCKYHTGQGMNGELLAGDATPQAAVAAAPSVKIVDSSLGKILTDGPTGLTLYTFKNDPPGKSTVSGNLANTWPPLIVAAGNAVPPAGLIGDLTLITRDDGAKQLAYKGQALYKFSRDSKAGDTTGNAVGNVWFAAAP